MQKEVRSKIQLLIIGSKIFYERVLPKGLKTRFELFYFDHRGFAEHPGKTMSYYSSLDDISKEIEEFRLAHRLNTLFLFGHSGHAYMALEYAKNYPKWVSGLILSACSPDLNPSTHTAAATFFENEADEFRKRVFEADMATLGQKIEENPNERFIHFVLCQKAKNWFDPNYDASWMWEKVSTHLPTLDYVWGKLFADYQVKSGLSKISCPVLFLQGEFDFVAGPASLWDPYLSFFQQVEVHIFDRSGHYPMVEEPIKFERLIAAWTSRLRHGTIPPENF